MTLSLRGRLTAAYTAALSIVLLLFGAEMLWQQGRIGVRRVDRELQAISATLANVVRDELTEDPDPAKAAEDARSMVTAPGLAVAIFDDRGTALAARWNCVQACYSALDLWQLRRILSAQLRRSILVADHDHAAGQAGEVHQL